MTLHTTSGRWRVGLALALLTCGFWATLPVALKISLETLDAYTLTWFRFLAAALFTIALLAARGQLGGFNQLTRLHWLYMVCAAAGLIGNYLLYLLGLKYTTPANAQLLIQSAPLLLALGGILFFKERVSVLQGLGFAAIVFGLSAFFIEQQESAVDQQVYLFGALLILLGAASWAGYALLQKQLLVVLRSQQIMAFIYLVAALVLLPLSAPSQLLQLDRTHWLSLAYCAINTIGAYGAFAEALEHWEASRVSATLALTPILTVLTVGALAPLMPQHLNPEQIGWLGWLGAAMVIGGSVCASLFRERT